MSAISAASTVAGILGLTFSVAAIRAARGSAMPKLRAAAMQYSRICTLVARSGAGNDGHVGDEQQLAVALQVGRQFEHRHVGQHVARRQQARLLVQDLLHVVAGGDQALHQDVGLAGRAPWPRPCGPAATASGSSTTVKTPGVQIRARRTARRCAPRRPPGSPRRCPRRAARAGRPMVLGSWPAATATRRLGWSFRSLNELVEAADRVHHVLRPFRFAARDRRSRASSLPSSTRRAPLTRAHISFSPGIGGHAAAQGRDAAR